MAWDLVPLNVADVAKETQTCKIYGKLYNAIKSGCLNKDDKDLSKFQGVFSSLYIQNEVIHFGSRICIPPKYHEQLLTELHATHIGVVSMKKVVRNLVWWPGISKAIENIAAKCKGCKKYKKKLQIILCHRVRSHAAPWREFMLIISSINHKMF